MGMVTLSACSNCGEPGKLRGLYCAKCHNAYRVASRYVQRAAKRMDARQLTFFLRIAGKLNDAAKK